tara:strand:+ start:2240 stop:3082 length:843 start_codon:yes stop_codon:yes gene_type:complete
MKDLKPGLYIVSTPIGNLNDITLRALDVLKKSEIILCEDTRRSLKLLNHFKIKKKLISYHKFNEKKKLVKIIEYLNGGKILSLISDAGTPTLSDPGHLLIKECINKKIDIYPIPGVSSVTASMSVSGFEDKFIFYGFLPKKLSELERVLSNLKKLQYSLVFFIPANKINFCIEKFRSYFSGRNILLAKEITKIHETFIRGEVDSIKQFKTPIKGEFTVVISKNYNKNDSSSVYDIEKEAMKYLKKYSLKDSVKLISSKNNISKNKVYKICLNIKKNEKNS